MISIKDNYFLFHIQQWKRFLYPSIYKAHEKNFEFCIISNI